MKVRIAVTPPTSVLTEGSFGEYLLACEELGFDTLWLSDVPLGPLGDPLISLAFAAAATKRLKLGLNLVPLGRNPMWVAKQLAQIDALSGGRLLISLVPGLGSAPERAALGHASGDRGRAIDEIIGLLRSWWSGDAVTATFSNWTYDGVAVLPRPRQDPLEIWLGGIGPAALDRVARLADGWLTASATPSEAEAGRLTIEHTAGQHGRVVDPEHFGISMPYARRGVSPATAAALRQRGRGREDLSEVLPVGAPRLISLIRAHIDAGLSKFVLRNTDADASATWRDDLEWLAEHVLPVQT